MKRWNEYKYLLFQISQNEKVKISRTQWEGKTNFLEREGFFNDVLNIICLQSGLVASEGFILGDTKGLNLNQQA